VIGHGADRHQGAWRCGQARVVGMLDLQQQINGGPHRRGTLGLQGHKPIGLFSVAFFTLLMLDYGTICRGMVVGFGGAS